MQRQRWHVIHSVPTSEDYILSRLSSFTNKGPVRSAGN